MALFVYILECSDGKLYTGITNDVERRISEHQEGKAPHCFTFKRRPIELKYQNEFENNKIAIDFEKQIKGWRRDKKMALIEGRYELLPELSKNNES